MKTTVLDGFTIRGTDGELGTIDQFYFDDETWAIRWAVVQTGGWLGSRNVLISPRSFLPPDWQAKALDVSLTKEQVKNSPDIDTHQPVSRQHEAQFLGYYGYPTYWGGGYAAGLSFPPLPPPNPPVHKPATEQDTHLRSTKTVTGYSIQALDGEIGHLDGFLLDDQTWAIRFLEVATRNWWPGKKVLVSPGWVERVSWEKSKVYAGLSREAIQTAPEYAESMPITRAYETQLYAHYGRQAYWLSESETQNKSTAGTAR
ncbi:MAG: PRC-barrel domain-containing protein [Acidobacteriota bacterium]